MRGFVWHYAPSGALAPVACGMEQTAVACSEKNGYSTSLGKTTCRSCRASEVFKARAVVEALRKVRAA